MVVEGKLILILEIGIRDLMWKIDSRVRYVTKLRKTLFEKLTPNIKTFIATPALDFYLFRVLLI